MQQYNSYQEYEDYLNNQHHGSGEVSLPGYKNRENTANSSGQKV